MRIRFREIKEIKEVEKEERKPEDENYKKIKPETNITKEECDELWKEIFGMG